MVLYKTAQNQDGTFSMTYTQDVQDVNGMTFTMVAEVHTRTLADIQTDVTNTQARIQSYQNYLSGIQAEIAAIGTVQKAIPS